MIAFLVFCCIVYGFSFLYKLIYFITGIKEDCANSLMAYCIISLPISVLIEVALILSAVWLS